MIVRFSDDHNENSSKLGNKAKFLIQMKKSGFHVPDGVVLDSDVYNSIIQYNKIDTTIHKLLSQINKNNIKEISQKLVELFHTVKINEDIIKEISNCLDEKECYAVRSSGTKEDLDNYSFAGQYDTLLNNKGMNQIEKSIIQCYQSMFSETNLSYLLNHNLGMDDLNMSVIIQKMVDADYSGICFTINPVTGNDKVMVIEVTKGLGDTIVSGKVKPEQYYYNWYDETYDYNKENKILNGQMLKEMTDTFLGIQIFFGYPCDIEFAIEGNQLYILQARRITKINYTDMHDMWTTADFKDGGVSATICTPFMWSLYEYIWEYTLRKFLLDSKILTEKELNKKLGDMFFARCYWNLSVVKLAMSKVIGYKEREFDSEFGIKITYDGDGATTKVSLKSITNIIKMYFAQKKIVKIRNENAEIYKKDLLQKYEDYKKKYQENELSEIETVWYKLTKDIYLQSESTYFWQIFINTIHQSLYKDGLLKYVSESEYLSLLGSIDGISHLLPFYDMWETTRKIRNDKAAFHYWQNHNADTILEHMNSDEYYLPLVRRIIDDYGYHSDKELDVTYPCYYEDAVPIIENIMDMTRLGDEFSPLEDQKRGKETYNAILKNIESKTNRKRFDQIKTKVVNMRNMLWWREEFRDISTRFYYIIRIYTLKLAEVYKDKEIIDEIEDIWFLKVGDIWNVMDGTGKSGDLKKIIEKNKQYYNSFKNYMSENEIGDIFMSGDNKPVKEGNVIKGLGANNGIVKGTARVIEDFTQIDRLQENDILVTKFTDTGWTPKFAILSGIVTEYGGILCHAAIVSREYGIPAIVSCHDVMSRIKDGQVITIDGTTGVVTIEEETL